MLKIGYYLNKNSVYVDALVIAITITVIAGRTPVDPGEIVLNFGGFVSPELEPYVDLQLRLEDIGENANLYRLSENERRIEESKLLRNPEVQNIIKECRKFHTPVNCNTPLYRKIDGTCNNPNHPKWGSANYFMDRLLPAAYNGQRGLRTSVNGGDLPTPRSISLKLKNRNNPSTSVSAMFTFFGQLVAHDLTLAPGISKNGGQVFCCDPSELNSTSCVNINFQENDPFYSKFNFTCMPFSRTAPYPKCNFERRVPMNTQTSFIDCSFTYGYNETEAQLLRDSNGIGRLKTQSSNFGDILPASTVPNAIMCPYYQTSNCFVAGDDRVNQNTILMALQTIFLRFHNKIVDRMINLNHYWSGEKVYQEVRRIVIAIQQRIVYGEYLPLLVGPEFMREYSLSVDSPSLYNNKISPNALVEFTTGSFRLHSMIPTTISKYHPLARFDETYGYTQPIHDGETEPLLAGSCEVASEKFGHYVKKDIQGFLYRPPGADYGTDLPAADIQRGRDHGIATYVDVVRKCSNGRIEIRNFFDLDQTMTNENINLLRSIYKSVFDIDLWVGIIMEKTIWGSVGGYTASCLSAIQFNRLKFGDSFFFTHTNGRNPHTEYEMNSIKSYTLAQMICETTKFTTVRRYPLLLPGENNPLLYCEYLPALDLRPWKEYL